MLLLLLLPEGVVLVPWKPVYTCFCPEEAGGIAELAIDDDVGVWGVAVAATGAGGCSAGVVVVAPGMVLPNGAGVLGELVVAAGPTG